MGREGFALGVQALHITHQRLPRYRHCQHRSALSCAVDNAVLGCAAHDAEKVRQIEAISPVEESKLCGESARFMGKSQKTSNRFAVGMMGNPQDCRDPLDCRKAGDFGAAALKGFSLRNSKSSQKPRRKAPGSFTSLTYSLFKV
jgi:hypothetical protein